MKLLSLVLVSVMFSQASFAGEASGAIKRRVLTCDSKINRIVSSKVQLIVMTKSSASEKKIQSITFSSRPNLPIGMATLIELKETHQDAYFAEFESKDLKVSLDKGTFKATINPGPMEYSCK